MTKYELISTVIAITALIISIFVSVVTLYIQSFRRHLEITVSMGDLGYTGSASYADIVLVNSGNQPVSVKDIVLMVNSRNVSPIDYNLRKLQPKEIQVVRLDVDLQNMYSTARSMFNESEQDAVDFDCQLTMVVFDTKAEKHRVEFVPGIIRVGRKGHGYIPGEYKKTIKWK